MSKRTKIENYSKLYYEKNKDWVNKKHRQYYQENKETRRCVIKLNGKYIDGIFHYGDWKHTTTMDRSKAITYNYYSALRVCRYYEKLGVKVKIIMLEEGEE